MSKTEIHSSYKISPEQMYEFITGKDKTGIDGYMCPKRYFDYRYSIWEKKREEILFKRKPIWPPEDWRSSKLTGKKEPPKRRNFIDQQIRWVKSFSDPVKSQEIKDQLESKGHKIDFPHPFKSDFDKKINKLHLLTLFKQRENELKKIRETIESIPDYKQNAIDEVKEKIENDEYKPNKGKSSWSKGDRVMYNEDNNYIGEQCPFWNPKPSDDGEDKKVEEFFPNKLKFLKKSPSYTFGPKNGYKSRNENTISEHLKARDEKFEERAKEVLDKMGVDKKTYTIDPLTSYHKLKEYGTLPHIIRKEFNFETQQYKNYLAKKKIEIIGPNTYWDDGNSKIKIRKFIDEEKSKKYVMTRDKTYKRLHIVGMRKCIF